MKKIICTKCCRKVSPNKVTTVDDKKFHRDCLRCEGCGSLLEDYSFRRRKEYFYCNDCYQEKLCQHCGTCSQVIQGGDIISVYDNDYHKMCFRCYDCDVFLGTDFHFYYWEGHLVCPSDHLRRSEEEPVCSLSEQRAENENVCSGKTSIITNLHPKWQTNQNQNGGLHLNIPEYERQEKGKSELPIQLKSQEEKITKTRQNKNMDQELLPESRSMSIFYSVIGCCI